MSIFSGILSIPVLSTSCKTAETGTAIPEKTLIRMEQALSAYVGKGYDYPWFELEEQGIRSLRLIGYGSLLNPESAARTVSDTPPDGHPPVLAMGARRVFEYVMPAAAIEHYAEGDRTFRADQRAALNTRFTGRAEDLLNGRVMEIRADDFEALREREFGYDLRPVASLPWGSWDDEPKIGYLLCAARKERNGRKILASDLAPFPPYLKLCEAGAAQVSPEFLRFFRETTYLGDGKTKLSESTDL